MLRSARHERFAQALARGAAVSAAYERVGYASGPRAAAMAARLAAKAEVKARLAEIKSQLTEIKARAAAPAEISVARLLDELEEARRLAILNKQPAAAISASMGKARIAGLIAEKAEGKAGTVLSVELTETEAARRIAFVLRLGVRAVSAMAQDESNPPRPERPRIDRPSR